MLCPKCGEEMKRYKEEPCYSQRKGVEYKRTYYRCERDDVWGQLEIPVGPLSEFDKQRAPSVATS
jgi:hypothetical protein